MFQRLVHDWGAERPRVSGDNLPVYTPAQVAEKVKRFFHYCTYTSFVFLPYPWMHILVGTELTRLSSDAINRHKMTTVCCQPVEGRTRIPGFKIPWT